MESDRFPLLGFPNESNEPKYSTVVYQCFFDNARIAIWADAPGKRYGINLYKLGPKEHITDARDRFDMYQKPIYVSDPLEAQMTIFFLLQKHGIAHSSCELPTGVTAT